MTTLLIVSSDHHVNSTVALCPPRVQLDDGGSYTPSSGQRWLWQSWVDAWSRVSALKDKVNPQRTILVLNGDAAELDTKRRSNQIVTPNKATILKMIADVFEQPMQLVDKLYIMRGTSAHTGKSSWIEEAFASDYESLIARDGKKGPLTWWHVRCVVEKLRIDISHHASRSSVPWTAKNSCGTLSSRLQWEYAVGMRSDWPHLAIRSHNHVFDRAIPVDAPHVYMTPCWSLLTEFGHRTGRENSKSSIGLLAFVIDGDDYYCKDYTYVNPIEEKSQIWKQQM